MPDPTSDHASDGRAAGSSVVQQDLIALAAELAAELPPLSRSEAVGVARIVAKLDAANNANASGQGH